MQRDTTTDWDRLEQQEMVVLRDEVMVHKHGEISEDEEGYVADRDATIASL